MSDVGIAITRYPASRGLLWLKEAFGMFSRARFMWVLLLLTYYAIMAFVDVIPWIGQVAVPVLKPIFAVGFLAAAWAQERGKGPALGQLFQGFRANVGALLPLGILLLAGATLSVMATSVVDGGTLLDLLSGRSNADDERLAAGKVQQGMLLGAVVALPVLLALWYAPALVVFHDCTPGRAIAYSLRACVVNWRALLVYGLLVLFYALVVPGLAMALLALVIPGRIGMGLAFTAMLPYLLFLVATLHISDYVSYRDIFHAAERTDTTVATGSA